MRLKIGKKLKTASLDSRFTGSKQEQCSLTSPLLKILKPIVAVNIKKPTNNLKSTSRHLKNCGMVKVVRFFFTVMQKYN